MQLFAASTLTTSVLCSHSVKHCTSTSTDHCFFFFPPVQGNGEPQSSTISCTQSQHSEECCKSEKFNTRCYSGQLFWLLQKPSSSSWHFQGGAWAEVCRLRDKYLTILRVCIGLSRNYYCAEVVSLREEQKQKAKGKNELPGSQMANRSHFEKRLHFALTEARDSARLAKSRKVKHEKVSRNPPEVQHQV